MSLPCISNIAIRVFINQERVEHVRSLPITLCGFKYPLVDFIKCVIFMSYRRLRMPEIQIILT